MPKTSVFNYLREVHRVLKPEGVVRFQVPNLLEHEQFESFKHFAEPYFVHHPYPMNFYTPAEVIQLTAKAGFWVEELTDDIMVRARKRKHAGIGLHIADGDDLVDLKARNRQLQQPTASSCSASTASSTTGGAHRHRCTRPPPRSERCHPQGELAPTSFEAGASQLLVGCCCYCTITW